MKSRSSTGVGQKIDLDYNIETMRITDEDPEGYADQQAKYRPAPSPNDIMNQVKPQSTVVGENIHLPEETKRVVADVRGATLKSLLKNLQN